MSEKRNLYEKMRNSMNSINEEFSRVEQSIILAHAMNVSLGLQCINRQGQNIDFPQNWRAQAKEGVYKFNYKYKDKTIQFRYVNNDGTVLYVNFVPEDSDELMKTQIVFEKEKVQDLMNFYEKQIKQKLFQEKEKQKKQLNNSPQIIRLQPVYRPYQGENPNIRPNMPLIIPPGNPYNSPFGRQDYVGPNSDIFQGRGGNRPNLQGGRRPPGSRFDPLDPFGNNDFDDGSSSNDFRGFNNMGQPFGGNNNRGPFI